MTSQPGGPSEFGPSYDVPMLRPAAAPTAIAAVGAALQETRGIDKRLGGCLDHNELTYSNSNSRHSRMTTAVFNGRGVCPNPLALIKS